MRYELNIGLDVTGGDNSMKARSDRCKAAMRFLTGGCAKVYSAVILGNMDGADEPCIYAVVLCSNMAALGGFICEALSQDCIAAAFNNGGSLIGPRATQWGEFNPEYFRRPAVVVAA